MDRLEVKLLDIKAESDAAPGTFSGYGAVFGNLDATGDVIKAGAFKDSLEDWRGRGKYPPMLLQHGGGFFGGGADDMLPVGQWTNMQEDRRGLKVDGQLFALGTERGQYIYEGLKAGVLDGLSIGFKTREFVAGTRPGEPDRTLTDIDLWEVSIVTFPANPKARITGVKMLDRLREVEDALRDAGYSGSERKSIVAIIREWIQRDAGPMSRPLPHREQRDAAAAGEISQLLEAMRGQASALNTAALQSYLSTTAAGGMHR
jgi:HK97 family phage prohead protease